MYIAQTYKYLHDWWRYAIPVAGFFALALFNYLIIVLFDMDVDQLLKERLEQIGPNWLLVETLAPMVLFLIAIFVWVRFVHKQPLVALTTSRKKVDWGRVFFGFSLIFFVSAGLSVLSYYMAPDSFVVQFEAVPFLILALISFILIPFQTSYEEYFFRGYMMQGIGVLARNRWLPLILTSVLFGGMHFPESPKWKNWGLS